MGRNIVLKILTIILILMTLCMGFLVGIVYYENSQIEKVRAKQQKEEAEEIIEVLEEKEEGEGSTEERVEAKKESVESKRQQLNFVREPYEKYTYKDMVKDIDILLEMYGEKLSTSILITTEDSRNVYDLMVGNQDSENQYIVTASIHAREYITTKLVMMQILDLLETMDEESNFLIHFIPMINPDGVSISQLGQKGIQEDYVRRHIEEIAQNDGRSIKDREYTRQWKANANGVDLNRNFDALWEEYEGPSLPSSDHYKGSFPGSEAETAGLIALTQNYPIKRTISYHTKGQVIYWYFGQTGKLLEESEEFARGLEEVTGYPTDENFEALDPAGYKDWALSKMGIPSVTIEVGYGEETPIAEEQIDELYEENKGVIGVLLRE